MDQSTPPRKPAAARATRWAAAHNRGLVALGLLIVVLLAGGLLLREPIQRQLITPAGPTAPIPILPTPTAPATETPPPTPTDAPLPATPAAWYQITAYNVDGVAGPPSAAYPVGWGGGALAPTFTPVGTPPTPALPTPVAGFVTRKGSQLLLNGQPFRFAGPNIYWLGLSDVPTLHYPSAFQVEDALVTARLMGATVIRAHSLGFSTGCALCIEPARGQFNETALQHVDFALMLAREQGLRVILPLTDNSYFAAGGKRDFTTWRGLKDETTFWTDPGVIADFKDFIRVMTTRVNSYTGVAYKDDPTILAWETGNELDAPPAWVDTISTFIKKQDPNHLVVDGNWGRNQLTDDLPLPGPDIYSIHGYPMSVSDLNTAVKKTAAAGKVFVLGEFGWSNRDKYGQPAGDPLDQYLAAIEAQPVIAGDLYWSLFPHADDSGYVQHNDEAGVSDFTLHWPGDTPDMRTQAALLRAHTYRMRGLPAPPADPPGAPVITRIRSLNGTTEVTWQGVAGGDTYSIARAPAPAGSWTVLCDRCATDNTVPWVDPTGGQAYLTEVSADKPSAYWRLDEAGGPTVHPSAGTVQGQGSGGLTFAQPGTLAADANPALFFDGSATLNFGRHYDFPDQTHFTLEMWVYPTLIDGLYRRILSKETYRAGLLGAQRAGYALSYSTPEKGGLYFSRANSQQVDEISYKPGLAANAWNYVVASYDGHTMALYLNGALVASKPSSLAMPTVPVDLTVGGRADGGDYFGGKLDELAIYPSTLSPVRIALHYRAALAPRSPSSP